MKIYSMTATFGKLEQKTLKLEPGLNVIHAPNEWGKSTWCAFLLNMLYGVDTKERKSQGILADKDRYKPWSGAAMAGRMELCWNGRDITIERSTGRAPMSEFRAYETESGLDVPELTAANCGQMLLGVERNVFTRAGFLRLTDMPVTQDEALRRRLNNLVTTGDESGDADKLRQTLHNLKNKCRSNRSNGLIPEAEAEREKLRSQQWDLQDLQQQLAAGQTQKQQLELRLKELENHQAALAYELAKENLLRVEQANIARDEAEKALEEQNAQCAQLPDRQTVLERLRQLEQLRLQRANLDEEILPDLPEAPVAPTPFADMDADQALQQASSDRSAYTMLCKKLSPLPIILAVLFAVAGIGLLFLKPLAATPFPVFAIVFAMVHFRSKARQKRDRLAVAARYGDLSPEQWVPLAQQYQAQQDRYEEQLASYNALSDNLSARNKNWEQAVSQAAEGLTLAEAIEKYNGINGQLDALQESQRAYQQAKLHAESLAAITKPVDPPKFPDTLTLTADETRQAITETRFQLNQQISQLGQYQGQMESLGTPALIKAKLDAVNKRIARLETYNNALELAQNALHNATLELQRRFSPQITKRTQNLFAKLTGDRYQKITMDGEMNLTTTAQDEVNQRDLRSRSDGTVDQLYLALRLAVSEALTPEAPIILDDALVRFDDTRLSQAMEILKEEAENKQVILFTCQKRELEYK